MVKKKGSRIDIESEKHAFLKSSSQSCEVIGFSNSWFAKRKFPFDMAGFAINVNFLASKVNQSMPYKVGYEEDYFLQSLNISLSELEPMSECCTEVYVWHTKTVSRKELPVVKYFKFDNTNLNLLMTNLEENGMVRMDERKGQDIFVCTDTNGCN